MSECVDGSCCRVPHQNPAGGGGTGAPEADFPTWPTQRGSNAEITGAVFACVSATRAPAMGWPPAPTPRNFVFSAPHPPASGVGLTSHNKVPTKKKEPRRAPSSSHLQKNNTLTTLRKLCRRTCHRPPPYSDMRAVHETAHATDHDLESVGFHVNLTPLS